MKKVLMIAGYYPPYMDSGATRSLKFSEYLQKFGWQPYVISVKSGRKSDRIPPGVKTYYTRDLFPFSRFVMKGAKRVNAEITSRRYKSGDKKWLDNAIPKILSYIKTAKTFFVPDFEVGWIPLTLIKSIEIIRGEGIDVIYATSPPPSALIIGAILKRITRKPLVVDFRDPWTRNHNLAYVTWWNKKLESFVVNSSDYIITNTPKMMKEFIGEYPYLEDRIILLTNGFDEKDLPKDARPFDKFTVTYTGTFGGTRSPIPFIKGLNIALENGDIPRSDIQVFFVGSEDRFVGGYIEKGGLRDVVRQIGYIPQEKSLEYVFKSNLLLLIEFSDSFPGKVFEYLASGKSIMAIITEGELKKFIEDNSERAYVICSNDSEHIERILVEAYKNWKDGYIIMDRKTKKFCSEYNREYLTQKLSEILAGVSSTHMVNGVKHEI